MQINWRKYILIILGIVSGIDICANEISEFRSIEDFSCIDHDANVLLVPGEHELLLNLYSRIDRVMAMGQGQISILHIGGSHVQAGIFSHRLRVNFRDFMGDYTGSKGIIFPFRTLGTNSPSNYQMTTTGTWEKAKCVDRQPVLSLGLKGAALKTSDSNASVYFDLKSNEDELWQYDRMIVLGEDENELVSPQLVCHGDTISPESFENGAYVFQLLTEASDGVVLFNGANESPVTFRGIIPQNSNSGLVYHEVGINGASVPSWLKCSLFEKELTYIKPDIVILGIGINDANVSPDKFNSDDFKQNYRSLLNRIKRVNPNVVFMFITNNDCKLNIRGRGKYNPNTLKVEQAFIDLAKEYNGVVWNLFRVMGGPESSKIWVEQELMHSDRIHFNRTGYEILGDLFFNAFVQNYRNVNIYE